MSTAPRFTRVRPVSPGAVPDPSAGGGWILAELRLDVPSVVTGLLHDTIEDTLTTHDELEGIFGKEVANLVDGVTKISKIHFKTKEESQAENFRKMILAMSNDIRVILVKLADRLHNMRTLQYQPENKQRSIAKETLDIYAPIANRLGISWIKSELEDLSFRYLNSQLYYDLACKVAKRKQARGSYVEEVKEIINGKLREHEIQGEVSGRSKHLYSIFKKMESRNVDIDQIYDLVAIRVLVEDIRECYEVLGIIHSTWKPIPGRFKDYIAMPKGNMYQSLHTTVIGPWRRADGGSDPDRWRCTGWLRRGLPPTGSTRKGRGTTRRSQSGSPGCGSFWNGSRNSRTRGSSWIPSRSTSFPRRSTCSPRAGM